MTREEIRKLVSIHPHQWYHELGGTPLQALLRMELASYDAIQVTNTLIDKEARYYRTARTEEGATVVATLEYVSKFLEAKE